MDLGRAISEMIENEQKQLAMFIQCLPLVTVHPFTIEEDSVVFRGDELGQIPDLYEIMTLANTIGLTPMVHVRDNKLILIVF